ncbi:MAG: acyl-CoA dehydrogenase family protein [Polaromonas sp.]|nr:acyl-CoA dehydrogenase family protein [Polaromonas sp.]
MNFLTDEQLAWKDSVHRWVDRDVGREYIRKCDMDRAFPYEAYEKAAKLGFHRLLVPEADGGDGGDIFAYALMCEALSIYGVDFSVAIAGGIFTAMNLALHGTPWQKKTYLEPFMRGEVRFPISMSEPNAGSDVANVQTRAERDGDHYVLNGQKLWCSGASNRGAMILMLVRTERTEDKRNGLSVIIVPNDTPGLTIRPLQTLARRSVVTTEIFLDNVRLPAANMLGAPGEGWKIIAGEHLSLERIAVAASYVGNAQGAVNDALAYAQQRVQFGKPIYEFQVLRHMLADMQTQTDAARLITYRAAELASRGLPCRKEVAMAKLFASETLQTVTRQGMQIMGGHGMVPESDMERYFREGMQSTIGGGTSQVQRTIIAQEMRV